MDNGGGRARGGGRVRGGGARRRWACGGAGRGEAGRGEAGRGAHWAPYIDSPPSSPLPGGLSPPDSPLLDGPSPPGSPLPVGPSPPGSPLPGGPSPLGSPLPGGPSSPRKADIPHPDNTCPDSGMSTSTGLDPRRPRVAEIVQQVRSHVLRPLEAYLLLTDIISDPNSVRSFLQDYFMSIGGGGRRHPEAEPFEVVFRRFCKLDPCEVDDAFRHCCTLIEDVSSVIDTGFIDILRSLELTITEVPLLLLMYQLREDVEFDMTVAVNQIIALD